jgi:DNA-binding NarL/FixJ family response regulator
MISRKISVKIEAKNNDIGWELEKMVLSSGGVRLHTPETGERPDLFILELSEKFDEEFKLLHSMLASGEVGEVFVTSDKKDADLLLKAMRAGIRSFFHSH